MPPDLPGLALKLAAKSDSNSERNVYKRKTSDEILTEPIFRPCLAGEIRTAQAQSTTLSTGFVDNNAGPEIARRQALFCAYWNAQNNDVRIRIAE